MIDYKKFVKRERILWHHHFTPSLFAGLIVAFVSYVVQLTVSNLMLFASVGASANILTNTRSHHLTRLHTVIIAYLIAIIISLGVYSLNKIMPLHISANIFLLIFLVGLFLYMFNASHPPAISASLSFILLDRPVFALIQLFIYIILLLIGIRFIVYVYSQHLPVSQFVDEFKKSF